MSSIRTEAACLCISSWVHDGRADGISAGTIVNGCDRPQARAYEISALAAIVPKVFSRNRASHAPAFGLETAPEDRIAGLRGQDDYLIAGTIAPPRIKARRLFADLAHEQR
jgi:hypothetical protein